MQLFGCRYVECEYPLLNFIILSHITTIYLITCGYQLHSEKKRRQLDACIA